MKNTQTQEQTRTLKRDRRLILLLILIMFLMISQLIVLLVNSGSISKLPEPVSVNKEVITVEDLKAVNADLKKVRKSLDEINRKTDLVEVKKLESKPVVVPAVNDPVTNDNVAAKKLENKAAAIPPAPVLLKPVVLKNVKNNTQAKLKVAQHKKVAPVNKSPAVVVPVSVSNSDKTIQANKKPAYIKLDINGKILHDNNEQWACVQDMKSGLMWEVKSKDDTMRNSNNLYSWFNPDDKTLKGVTDGGRCKGGTDCDTNAYVEAMNRQKFCGHNDWRLPTEEEMLGLVNYESGADNVTIDTSYFPYTLPSWYWTASSNNTRPEFAWYVLFKNGLPLNDLKENPKHVRLVRNESSS